MRLTKQQETALLASIKEWKAKSNARHVKDVQLGGASCPLCQEFFSDLKLCRGCPVRQITGHYGCNGTPYYEAVSCLRKWQGTVVYGYTPSEILEAKKAWVKAALAEVAFLRSLLPAKHPQR